MATTDLQNSYGPEMAQIGHDLPQAVVGDGPEAMYPGQQHPVASPYSEQYAKDNNQYNNSPPGAPIQPQQKRRVLSLPVVAFWGIVIGLVLALAVGLGVGLSVGLGQSRGGSSAAVETTSSASAGAATTSAATATASSSTASSSTTTTSSTTSSTSAAATARNVEICNQASLVSDSCTNLTVPVNTCSMFSISLSAIANCELLTRVDANVYQSTFHQHIMIALVLWIQEDPNVIFTRTFIFIPPLIVDRSKSFLVTTTTANMRW